MNQRHLIFDASTPEAEKLTQRGIDRAERRAGSDLLDLARRIAVKIAMSRPDRTATADDVVAELVRRGHSQHALGRAAGGVFRGSAWEFTGRRVRSERAHGHGNELKVWRFIGPLAQVSTAQALPQPKADPSDEFTHCPRCRRSTASAIVLIHGGRSTRLDCKFCGAFKSFGKWDPAPTPSIAPALQRKTDGR